MSRADTDPARCRTPAAGAAEPPVRTAAQARAAVAAVLGRRPAADERLHGDACLAVTELVTNAIRHAGGVTGFAVRGEPDGGPLTIEVEDSADAHPHGGTDLLQDPARPGGRGWPLVQLLSSSWEIHPLPEGGKRIRVTLAPTGRRGADAC
ncbi:ATP-binding protein [Kitasatospora sp. NPDC088134]|uniref:ATP-binding protein n=1 Tax=Kitasatospora sp. NPDC088134 TaxID=3364071 RepID=UPI003811CFF6